MIRDLFGLVMLKGGSDSTRERGKRGYTDVDASFQVNFLYESSIARTRGYGQASRAACTRVGQSRFDAWGV